MARGESSHRTPKNPGAPAGPDLEPGQNAPVPGPAGADGVPGPAGADGVPGKQREILEQFEAAIAGMHTREIQIGLRHLLGGVPPAAQAPQPRAPQPRAPGPRAPEPPASNGQPGNGTHRSGAVPGAGDLAGAGHQTAPAAGGRAADGAPDLAPDLTPAIDLTHLPAPVADLVLAIQTPSARRQMERLVSDANLGRWAQIDTDTAVRMVRPYTWLLNRVSGGGLKLTDAGHLPPAQVQAAVAELDLAARWAGHTGRENQALPVLQLRESAQAAGLLHRHRGRLMLTSRGAEIRSDPAALWWHLAERMPLQSAAACEVQPGLILLTCVAGRFTDTVNVTIARMLSAMGWVNSDGSPLSGSEAAAATGGTYAVLRHLGALPYDPCPDAAPWPTPEGVAFARAALRTWPSALSSRTRPG